MKLLSVIMAFALLSSQFMPFTCTETYAQDKTITNQWNGKKVAYLGDSITDKIHVGTTKNYWQYLQDFLGIEPIVYGINGHQWNGILEQAKKLKAEQGDNIDAILIFAGTNDYNASLPLGEWYTIKEKEVEVSGPKIEKRMQRTYTMNDTTFRGRINEALSYLKTNYPTKQIILLTPIHRGYAKFGDTNIQPDESYSNKLGLYVDEYVEVLKEAGNIWAMPVIDLNSLSGIYPNAQSQTQYIHKEDTDRLHPNAAGHERMAKTLMYQLLALPCIF